MQTHITGREGRPLHHRVGIGLGHRVAVGVGVGVIPIGV
jgi:hypothetical protein